MDALCWVRRSHSPSIVFFSRAARVHRLVSGTRPDPREVEWHAFARKRGWFESARHHGRQSPMSKLKSLWQRFKVRCRPLIPWVRYAYFLRFSILLWVFPPLLVGLNCASAPRALISGIVTPTRWVQYLCVTFFLIASSFVSLILARIVIVNGKERFDEEPPERLTKLFADPKARHEWIAPIASLANTAGVLV
jgi:hypothetical protein